MSQYSQLTRGFDNRDVARLIEMRRREIPEHEIAKAMNRPVANIRWKLARLFGGQREPEIPGARPCMRCRSPFVPAHKFNRLCHNCNSFAATLAPGAV